MIRKFKNVLIAGLLAFASITFIFTSCNGKKDKNAGREGFQHFSVKSFRNGTGWGYRIYQDTAAVIEQPFIPGMAGNVSFSTEEQALKTGRLVEQKLENGIFPPTVTMQELDSMKIKY
ncbi:DUF4907 domain-containing protein [Dyadobacter sediminis]|uniref:DUF4907 domain-containing protein n=1 Tax=Dyadobacter sediminis TaxID=1493691 RepID=A0A5R9KFF3_9BACT|nr:DUF4907 domain-containing protein [Dyadobacter sediminis]TLU94771.1 DUF4907 domain-containing protein [Dyadobacter sediminis]GGB88309.1 hypothetical protein GCM10011325_14780 [Dyadobacter sediminis]